MGWFWATAPREAAPDLQVARQSIPSKLDAASGGAFWAPQTEVWAEPSGPTRASSASSDAQPQQPSGCPVDHSKFNWFGMGKKSPDASQLAAQSQASSRTQPGPQPETHATEPASACPVDHSKFSGKFNSMNNMPSLSSSKLPGQTLALPTERTTSSIPKGEVEKAGFWEYPSPQQMLNAMVRKTGPEGIPEDAVESMVNVHNFLNEGVWQEVVEWEKPHSEEAGVTPRLLRFQGRPGDLSPKARIIQALGAIYPSKFGCPPPFDRHDWTVLRAIPGKQGEWQPVRYVIDFYEIPDGDGEDDASFTVDVRPAADSISNIIDRTRHTWGPLWSKAMGWS